MSRRPCSHPWMTWPFPTMEGRKKLVRGPENGVNGDALVNSNGLFRSREESNFSPLDARLPV